jgi:hypothetical protein
MPGLVDFDSLLWSIEKTARTKDITILHEADENDPFYQIIHIVHAKTKRSTAIHQQELIQAFQDKTLHDVLTILFEEVLPRPPMPGASWRKNGPVPDRSRLSHKSWKRPTEPLFTPCVAICGSQNP